MLNLGRRLRFFADTEIARFASEDPVCTCGPMEELLGCLSGGVWAPVRSGRRNHAPRNGTAKDQAVADVEVS